jgi:DNA recombination protein RmuC
MGDVLIYLLLALAVANLLAVVLLLLRKSPTGEAAATPADLKALESAFRDEAGRSRSEAADSDRQSRQELQSSFASLTETVSRQLTLFQQESSAARQELVGSFTVLRTELNTKLDAFGEQQVARFASADTKDAQQAAAQREEIKSIIASLSDTLVRRVSELAADQRKSAEELKTTVTTQLTEIRTDNEKRLEQMRLTVDEKLQTTLDQRLGESFKLVSERLENVQKGLGQMQQLATDVGSLQKVMSNVKTRGIWGEVLLGNLLEQVLSPEQFEANVATSGRSERVEFAVKLPGKSESDAPVWLPIDSKFPKEDYERLLAAQEAGDAAAAAGAGKALDTSIRAFAEDIRSKYIEPPATTDFAIMFLPSEGLYAEVLRRTETVEHLQLKCKVLVTGPTTLAALLNSLQMGFKTLAIQKRSSEVWDLLGAVKTEFGKYADLMKSVKTKLEQATKTLDDTEVRTRAINRKLRGVEQLSPEQTQKLLPGQLIDVDDAES